MIISFPGPGCGSALGNATIDKLIFILTYDMHIDVCLLLIKIIVMIYHEHIVIYTPRVLSITSHRLLLLALPVLFLYLIILLSLGQPLVLLVPPRLPRRWLRQQYLSLFHQMAHNSRSIHYVIVSVLVEYSCKLISGWDCVGLAQRFMSLRLADTMGSPYVSMWHIINAQTKKSASLPKYRWQNSVSSLT